MIDRRLLAAFALGAVAGFVLDGLAMTAGTGIALAGLCWLFRPRVQQDYRRPDNEPEILQLPRRRHA